MMTTATDRVSANALVPGWARRTVAENVRFENVFRPAPGALEGEPKPLFRFFNAELRNVAIDNVYADGGVPPPCYEGECSGSVALEAVRAKP